MSKYKDIYNLIIQDIENNVYKPNQKLPSEKELATIYSVSINTIRKALQNLIISGYIVSRHGSGYYISIHQNFNSLQLKSIKDIHSNDQIESKILDFRIIQANEEQASKLSVPFGCALYNVKRIRYINGSASLIEDTFIPVHIFPTLNQNVFKDSFYHYVDEHSKYKIERAIKSISAINADEQIANIFNRNIGSPTLVVENYGFLSDGTQFEYSRNIHNDNNFSICVPRL